MDRKIDVTVMQLLLVQKGNKHMTEPWLD